MISSELRRLIAAARSALLQDSEWSMMNSLPEGASGYSLPATYPTDYSEFLQVANGVILGRIVVFGASIIEKMQFYADPVAGVPVQLNRDEWFSFGKVNEDPMFIRRSDNTIWGFPDMGVIWWQSDRFERFAENLDAFISHYAFGPDYLPFTGANSSDQWWRFLRQLDRAV
jgi:hypothetical protein